MNYILAEKYVGGIVKLHKKHACDVAVFCNMQTALQL